MVSGVIKDARDFGNRCIGELVQDRLEDLEIAGGVVREERSFCYLGEVVSSEGGAARAIKVRISAAWIKWREISGLLTNKGIPLKHRANVYSACIRPVLLYGSETRGMTQRLEKMMVSCDRRMLRYMAGVTWRDMVGSEEVARRCGVRQLHDVMASGRLRWYGHVQRREGDEALGRVRDLHVPGIRNARRPKKTWLNSVKDDMRLAGLVEGDVFGREKWRLLSNPIIWEKKTLKGESKTVSKYVELYILMYMFFIVFLIHKQ